MASSDAPASESTAVRTADAVSGAENYMFSAFSRLVAPAFTSAATGAVVGTLLGGGFHVALGTSLRLGGRKQVTWQMIGRDAGKSAFRFGGVLGLFSAVRAGAELALHGLPSADQAGTQALVTPDGSKPHIVPSLIAGAVAVAAPSLLIPQRRVHLRERYAGMLNKHPTRINTGLLLLASCMSGACTFGVADYAVRYAGIDWS